MQARDQVNLKCMPDNHSEVDITKPLHNLINYPKLHLGVWIVGNCFLTGTRAMFAKTGCYQAKSLEDAELVVFLGGEDINPSLYGEKPRHGTYFSDTRDAEDMDAFVKAMCLDIPMFGICRGMQFVHAMSGGKLYQDVDHHGRPHSICDINGRILTSSSMHHQMCVMDEKICQPIAFATPTLSRVYRGYGTQEYADSRPELEAAFYEDAKAFCVQGHPEVGGYDAYTRWCMEKLDDHMQKYLTKDPDFIDPLEDDLDGILYLTHVD